MAVRIERRPGWPGRGERGIVWLGQAGFWIETGQGSVLIDPYLSDSLARKYAGTGKDYRRMMPPPVLPCDLPRPDVVLVTHAHTDHMDPETLGPLVERFPGLCVIVPAAQEETARARIGEGARVVPADAGDVLTPLPGLRITVLPAAHETRERDGQGRHLFLGYGIGAGDVTLYHSGDCVPFEGLEEAVRALAPDVALLPVNGRDAARLSAGIPGNFTLEEAIGLARAAGAGVMVAHHFGMFAGNSCATEAIDAAIDAAAAARGGPAVIRPVTGEVLRIAARGETGGQDGGQDGGKHGREDGDGNGPHDRG